MYKRIALFCALVGVLAFLAGSADAEVQNIKVSGDIQVLAVHRSNYDLEDGDNISYFTGSNYIEEDADSFLQSNVRLRIDADLTDNVSATVRLANLREWDTTTTDTTENYIVLDLANITLKEMLYSPLTLIIGRQELNYGNGLIIGYGLFQDPNNSIKYNDLSPLQGYDAVRAILDYDPWTIDLLMAKMQEDDDIATATDDERNTDTDLYGINVGYLFDQYDAEAEGYFFYKKDENFALTLYEDNVARNVFDENLVYTIGARGSVVPVENLTLGAEVAGQFGEIYEGTAMAVSDKEMKRDRQAMMAYASGQYDFPDVRFSPVVGVSYLYTSGEETGSAINDSEIRDDSDFEAWDPMHRGKINGTIRDCLENLFATNDSADTSGFTNQHTVKLGGSLDLGELVDGLSLDMAYLHYWFDEEPSLFNKEDDIGDEINVTVSYDYTEDVEFMLDGAWFMPGDYYDNVHSYVVMSGGGMAGGTSATRRVSNDTAVSILGSCKVTF